MVLRACKECGQKISNDAKTCPNCGKPQAKGGLGCVGVVGILILVGIIGAVVNHGSGGSGGGTEGQGTSSSSKSAGPKFEKSNVPHPKYHIYRQVPKSGLISVVVARATTDEQLKSLLWFFREKVRAHELKELGMTERLENGGIIIVYRDEKCANEEFIDQLGPCGYGDHNDAHYQWGIHGDPSQDAAYLRNKNRQETAVFDSSDNWQLPPAEKSRLEAARKLREDFAVTLSLSFQQEGLDVTASVDRRTLDLDSKLFENGSARRAFIHGLLSNTKTVKQLCDRGFETIQAEELKGILAGYVGNRASLNCR